MFEKDAEIINEMILLQLSPSSEALLTFGMHYGVYHQLISLQTRSAVATLGSNPFILSYLNEMLRCADAERKQKIKSMLSSLIADMNIRL